MSLTETIPLPSQDAWFGNHALQVVKDTIVTVYTLELLDLTSSLYHSVTMVQTSILQLNETHINPQHWVDHHTQTSAVMAWDRMEFSNSDFCLQISLVEGCEWRAQGTDFINQAPQGPDVRLCIVTHVIHLLLQWKQISHQGFFKRPIVV